MENFTDLETYYGTRLLRNDLTIPIKIILSENWKNCSWWKKIKYLINNKFSKREAQIQLAIDYYLVQDEDWK